MIDLRVALHAKMRSIHPRAYFGQAPKGCDLPYVTYSIPGVYDDGEGHQRITLDIDGWDAPADGDTTAIETLMSQVNAGMDKVILDTPTSCAVFYLESKLTLDDDDPLVKRRKYIYQGHLFERRDI